MKTSLTSLILLLVWEQPSRKAVAETKAKLANQEMKTIICQ